MKLINYQNRQHLVEAILLLLLLCSAAKHAHATAPFPGSGYTNTALATWSFSDTARWTSDQGYAPLSLTNLAASNLGNGTALLVDSTNAACVRTRKRLASNRESPPRYNTFRRIATDAITTNN